MAASATKPPSEPATSSAPASPSASSSLDAAAANPRSPSPLSPAARPFYPGGLLQVSLEDGDEEMVDYSFSPSPSPPPPSPRPASYRDAVAIGLETAVEPGAPQPVRRPTEPQQPPATQPAGKRGRRRPSRRTRQRRPPPDHGAGTQERVASATQEQPHPRARDGATDGRRRPRVDEDGFQEYLSRSSRRRLRREQDGPPPQPPLLPLRCLRCHGFRHLARDCRFPSQAGLRGTEGRGPVQRRAGNGTGPALQPAAGDTSASRRAPTRRQVSSRRGHAPQRAASSAANGGRREQDPGRQAAPRRFYRVRGSPTPPASEAPSRTPSPPPSVRWPSASPPQSTGPARPEPELECCYVDFTEEIAAEEARLRHSLICRVGNATDIPAAEAAQAIAADTGFRLEDFVVKSYHPENFLIECSRREVRDRLLAANSIPIANTNLNLRPWTRLVGAQSLTMYAKVKLELVGIPLHAWNLNTVRKLLADYCWVERLEKETADKSNLAQFTLTAWTRDPFAIPASKELRIAEREVPVTHPDPEMQLIFGRVTPYIREKRVLRYRVDFHLRSIADFAPRTPPPTWPSSPSDDGDSGPDGNPDRSYGFRQGTAGPRLMGFHRRDRPAGGDGGGGRSMGSGGPGSRAQGGEKNNTTERKTDPTTTEAASLPKKEDSNREIETSDLSPAADKTSKRSSSSTEPEAVHPAKAPWPVCDPTVSALERQDGWTPTGEDPMLLEASITTPRGAPPPTGDMQTVESTDPCVKATVLLTGQDERANADEEGVKAPGQGAATEIPQDTPRSAPAGDPATEPSRMSEKLVDSLEHSCSIDLGPAPTGVPSVEEGTGPGDCNAHSGPAIANAKGTTRPELTPSHLMGRAAIDEDVVASPTPTATQHRDPASAKLSAFTKELRRKVQSPLAPKPVKTKRALVTPLTEEAKLPKRSERLAKHPLAQVASSKRAEVVLKRRFQPGSDTGPVSAAAKQAYEKFYAPDQRQRNYEAMQDLMPSLRSVCQAVGMQA
ncbi:unnamed protein product [Urochloa humidicola]